MKLIKAARALKGNRKRTNVEQLYTIWGESLSSDHVLQEYPRPQLMRESYINLNGLWEYCINFGQVPEEMDGAILVPFSPETLLSGVNRILQPGESLWYRRNITIDYIDITGRLLLHFGAVDERCEVYVNDTLVESHQGGYLPFSFDITDMIHEGNNTLIVRVEDDTDTSFHARGKQSLDPHNIMYTGQSGIWQTVWMEWVPSNYIKKLQLIPDIDKELLSVTVDMQWHDMLNESEVSTVSAKVYYQDQLVKQIKSSDLRFDIQLSEVKLWSPEQPNLYDLVIETGEDVIKSYFAMRKISVKPDANHIMRIYLNNKIYFQRGVLDQGYWSDGLYTAPSDAALIYDIGKMKELGFNMIRKHVKIEPMRWYYHCDRMGMLVWQDMINGGETYNSFYSGVLPALFPNRFVKKRKVSPKFVGRLNQTGMEEWTSQLKEMIGHLNNSPCIVVWVPFNEGWGQFKTNEITQMVKELDPNRLILQASGWFDGGSGDIKGVHNYFRKLKVRKDKRAFALSEFGGYAYYVEGHSYAKETYGYQIFNTKKDLTKAYLKVFHEDIYLLIPQGLCACVYTQLSDVEEEVNGLLTFDRKECKIELKQIRNSVSDSISAEIELNSNW